MTMTKAIWIAPIMIAALTASLSAQVDQDREQRKAAFATLFDGCQSVLVDVAEITRNGTTETHLNYLLLNHCTLQLIGRGDGIIPNEEFKVTGGGAHLSTTVSSRPGLEVIGLTGLIELEWKDDGLQLLRSSGQTVSILFDSKSTQQHVASSESADVNGVVLGVLFEHEHGSTNMSVNHFMESTEVSSGKSADR